MTGKWRNCFVDWMDRSTFAEKKAYFDSILKGRF